MVETRDVADLGHQADGADHVDAAQRAQRPDHTLESPALTTWGTAEIERRTNDLAELAYD
jgi:hypothetical protein